MKPKSPSRCKCDPSMDCGWELQQGPAGLSCQLMQGRQSSSSEPGFKCRVDDLHQPQNWAARGREHGKDGEIVAMLRQALHLLDLDEYVELWLVPRIVKGGLGGQPMRELRG